MRFKKRMITAKKRLSRKRKSKNYFKIYFFHIINKML
jgi:hypothetical protein